MVLSCHIVLPLPTVKPILKLLHTSLDLFSFGGKQYLICVDHWSGYPLFSPLRSLSSDAIIKIHTAWFNLFGWPTSICSDGGPQFCGNFPRFCRLKNITHELSVPYNPKSNGLAEAGVKSVKKFLRKSHHSGEAQKPRYTNGVMSLVW